MYILGIQRNKLEWFNSGRFYGGLQMDVSWVVLCWADECEKRGGGGLFFLSDCLTIKDSPISTIIKTLHSFLIKQTIHWLKTSAKKKKPFFILHLF